MLPEPSSSVGTKGEDVMLEDLPGYSARGGANPSSSKGSCFCLCFSGDPCREPLGRGEGNVKESFLRAGEAEVRSSGCSWVSFSSGDGERTLLVPKNGSGALNWFSCRPREGSRGGIAGTFSSGGGGIRLRRGCMDLGRSVSSLKASSSSVLIRRPSAGQAGASPESEPESWDMERK